MIGRTLGDFRLDEVIDESEPAGTLYRATELSQDRTVAVRVISPALAQSQGFEERFLDDMEALSGAFHPNVLSVYAAAREDDDTLWASTRHRDARTLRDLIADAGPLDPTAATQMLSQLSAGLAFAHERGVIHRGLSSRRVEIAATESGDEVTLTGFGLTGETERFRGMKKMPDDAGPPDPDYASPEQVAGKTLDPRSDLYSLGCVIYEAVTGSPPFANASGWAKLKAHADTEPPPIAAGGRELPKELVEIVSRLLAKKPRDRFENAQAVVRAAEGLAPAVAAVVAAAPEDEGAAAAVEEEPDREAEAAEEPEVEVGAEAADAEPPIEPAEPGWQRRRRGLAAGALAGAVAATLAVLAVALDEESEPVRDSAAKRSNGSGPDEGPAKPGGKKGDQGEPRDSGDEDEQRDRGKDRAGQGGGTDRIAPWPPGTEAYTAVAYASPTNREEAVARARQASRAGLRAGVLDSTDYPSLVPGVWVAFAGIYETEGEAADAVARLQRAGVAAAPYVRFIGQG